MIEAFIFLSQVNRIIRAIVSDNIEAIIVAELEDITIRSCSAARKRIITGTAVDCNTISETGIN